MGTFSNQNKFPSLSEGNEVYKLGPINLIQDYIPHPNSIIDQTLSHIASSIEHQIRDLQVSGKGPYISKLYGKIREEAYLEFERMVHDYAGNKKNGYMLRFYKNVDLKCQELFEEVFDLRDIYRRSIWEKETRRSNLFNINKENSQSDRQNPDPAETALKKDIEELSIDWYLLIEKTVDLLIRCQLYKVKKGCIYRDISNRIKKQWWQDDKLSWKDRLTFNWNLAFRPFKQVFKKKDNPNGDKMPYAEAMDCSDVLVLITWAACGETVSKFFKQLRKEEDNKELLANIKGFLLLVTQNLEPLLARLESQFEKCLNPMNNKDFLEKQKGLDNLINEVINIRENVSFFESSISIEKYGRSRLDTMGLERFGSDMINSMKMNRKVTETQEKNKKGVSGLKVMRSKSFHHPSSGIDFY